MKICFAILFCVSAAFPAQAGLAEDTVYFFTYKNCPYCKLADKYIKQHHPTLKVEKIEISGVENTLLYLECAAKHGFGESAGTPLFCIGKNFIRGWDGDAPRRFDAYVAAMP